MKIYYVGKIVENQNNELTSFIVQTQSCLVSAYSKPDNDYLKLNKTEFAYLKENLKNHCKTNDKINDDYLKKILSKGRYDDYNIVKTIIYELVQDTEGTFYAKELISNLLFPIPKCPQTEYYYEDYNKGITKIFIDENNNLARFRYIVFKNEVASKNRVMRYLEDNKTANNEDPYIAFKTTMTKYYNENVFNKEIVLKEENKEKQNELTKIIEDIEYLLNILKKQNLELYKQSNKDYLSIINKNKDSLVYCEPSKKDLLNILSTIKLNLLITENECTDIFKYLNNAIENYYIKMINKEICVNDININDLDNFSEMFLISKDNYTIEEQRDILKKIALLYLFVVKHNIDSINIDNLDQSYFKDFIKTIVLHISGLYESTLIKDDISIDYKQDLNVEYVLNLIRNMEFNNLKEENTKKLIK